MDKTEHGIQCPIIAYENKDEKNTMTESPDVIIGEVLPDEKADGKKSSLCPGKVTMWRLALSSRKATI